MRRHFLGFEQSLPDAVCDVLATRSKLQGRAMDHLLVVCPTQQAGRRLRESLAVRGGSQGNGLLAPQVISPHQVLQPDPPPQGVASPLQVRALWAEILRQPAVKQRAHLFPGEPTPQTYAWALHLGQVLDGLRNTLLDGGLGLIEVAERFADQLPEPGRWHDLAHLERQYVEALAGAGLLDPCAVKRRAAQAPTVGASIEEVIVACVPDLAPIVRQALERLADDLPVEILVHAPPEWTEWFDGWGQPVPGDWEQMTLPIRDEDIVLAGAEEDQCRAVLDCLREPGNSNWSRRIGIGAPDRAVVPFLLRALADHGIEGFDPAPQSIERHRAVQLVAHLGGLLATGTYSAGARLLRHPDLLGWMEHDLGVEGARVLEELDQRQNQTLPRRFEDLVRHSAGPATDHTGLSAAVSAVQRLIRTLEEEPHPHSLLAALQTVYAPQVVDPRRSDDAGFVQIAREITSGLRETERPPLSAIRSSAADRMTLLIEHLRSVRLSPERDRQPVDIEGWLELPWISTPMLAIAGLNEGIVPESLQGDAFLSDSVRRRLGLRTNRERFARDAFLLRALIASRRPGGVRLILGKTNQAGDPLKPSRLLFLCPDDLLPQRAARLFGEPEHRRPNVPATLSFRLEPLLPTGDPPDIGPLPVTAFGEYLACPFRFFLRRVGGMEALDDQKEELDARDFGILVHAALRDVLGPQAARANDDADDLGRVLAERAERMASARWGPELPLPVEIQLQSAQQRLRAAARVHVALIEEGWDVQAVECPIQGTIEGVPVAGQIDRIDRHRTTGIIRILDYKTAERCAPPEADHLGPVPAHTQPYAVTRKGNKSRAWRGLQLPLYAILWTGSGRVAPAPVEVGYFHLPKAVNETAVEIWSGLDADLLPSAQACAVGIVRDIQAGRFWPPTDRVQFETFASLFPRTAAECVDPDRFLPGVRAWARQRKAGSGPNCR